MAIRYYPLSRVIPNQYTNGGDYVKEDGTPYVGRFYTLYNNEVYTGSDPLTGTNEQLFPTPRTLNRAVTSRTGTNTRRQATQVGELPQVQPQQQDGGLLTELVPYYPTPTEEDYARGYFTRYFAKNVTGPGFVVEISENDWTNIQNGQVPINVLAYETADLFWQLVGPLNNKRVSQYQIIGGVYDTNKRVTEAKAKSFVGLLNFIDGDYTKFARITP